MQADQEGGQQRPGEEAQLQLLQQGQDGTGGFNNYRGDAANKSGAGGRETAARPGRHRWV